MNSENFIEFDLAAGISLDQVRSLIDGAKTRPVEMVALYETMKKTGELTRNRLVSYRCSKGCLLLDVYQTPDGPAAYRPGFKYSPQANEATSPAARLTRTTDGDRRWVANADMVLSPPLSYLLACNHVQQLTLEAVTVHTDLGKRAKGPILL